MGACHNKGSATYITKGRNNSVGTPGITLAQTKEIDRIANRTRNLKKEQYRIVNENGEVVLNKQGKEHEVAATVGEKREYMSGAVSIHNHPNGGTFSYDDMSDFGYGARGIVAASPEGNYKLTNTRYGTKQQYSGWRDMQEAMEKAGVTKEISVDVIIKQAKETPKIKKLADQRTKVANQWAKAKDAGKPKEHLDKLSHQYTQISNKYTSSLNEEMRKLETKPYHDFYKKNASKYGFKYEFISKK